MKKYIICLVMLIAILLASVAVMTVNGEDEDPVYVTITGFSYKRLPYGGAVIVGTKLTGHVVFPNTVDGYRVVKIGDGTRISGSYDITSFVLPSSVVEIGDSAFSGAPLEMLSIGGNVRTIGEYAFSGCSLIKQVYLGNSLTSVGSNAFLGCKSLEEIEFSDGITEISSGLLSGCTSLEKVTIPSNITKIGGGAFRDCTSLESVSIPDSVEQLGQGVFLGCKKLSQVDLGKGITAITNSMFHSCVSLKSISIPENVTVIDDYAFAYSGLKSLSISKNVSKIGIGTIILTDIEDKDDINIDPLNQEYYHKDGCIIEKSTKTLVAAAKNFTMPHDGRVEIIAAKVFTHHGFSTFVIPESITEIGDSAFPDCDYLYINSSVIAEQLTNDFSCGGLILGTIELYIRSDITNVPEYVKERFTYTKSVVENGISYTYYCDHIHSFYDRWIVGEGGYTMMEHWHECEICSHRTDVGEHEFDNSCDPSCNVCGKIFFTEHQLTQKSDKNYHWTECSVCGYKESDSVKEHRFDSGCLGSCIDCGYKLNGSHSVGDGWYCDGNRHWKDCERCGAMVDVNDHSFSSNWESDDTNHYHACLCGWKTNVEEHIPGPEATENTPQICRVCNAVLTPAIGHQHDEDGQPEYNEMGHWTTCTCGDRLEYGLHTMSEPVIIEPKPGVEGSETSSCTFCGFTVVTVLDPLPDIEPDITADETPDPSPTPTPVNTPEQTIDTEPNDKTPFPPFTDSNSHSQNTEELMGNEGGNQNGDTDENHGFEKENNNSLIIILSVSGVIAVIAAIVVWMMVKRKKH